MIRLAVASQKGGVGKTTLALNLAHSFAQRGHRTLLVDTDPQGGVGLSLARKQSQASGFSAYIRGKATLADVAHKTRLPNLHLIMMGNLPPADIDLFSARLGSVEGLDRFVVDAEPHFDLVLFDTPSGLGGITRKVLERATHVLSPIQAEPLAFRSVHQLLELVSAVREQGHDLSVAGFVLVMLQVRTEYSLGVAQEYWSHFPPELLVEATVPRDHAFLAAGAAGVPLALLSRNPPAVSAIFDQIALELEPRLGLGAHEADEGPIDLLV